MSIGTSVPLPAYTIDPAFMAKAEELGFESIWYAEHPAVPAQRQPLPGHRRRDSLDLFPFHRSLHRLGQGFRGHPYH